MPHPTLAARKLTTNYFSDGLRCADQAAVLSAVGYRILSTSTLDDEVSSSLLQTFACGPLLGPLVPRPGPNYWFAVCSWVLEWAPRLAVSLFSRPRTPLLLFEVLL